MMIFLLELQNTNYLLPNISVFLLQYHVLPMIVIFFLKKNNYNNNNKILF